MFPIRKNIVDPNINIKPIHKLKVFVHTDKLNRMQTCKKLVRSKLALREIRNFNAVTGKSHIANLDFLAKDPDYYYIYMDYYQNGNLYDYVCFHEFEEKEIKNIILQILIAIKHCHDLNIVHGDIKLENFVVNDDKYVTLIDFGCSQRVQNNDEFISCRQGSVLYMSPEMIDSKIHLKSDIWAVGIIMYFLLFHLFPFDDTSNSPRLVWQKILSKKLVFDKSKYSENCNDFLNLALKKNIYYRMTVDQALSHNWFKN